ncbi:hypothetical protein TNCV_1806151 [Trichonephila clavipes]|nr:hypothetical protein TNCV_1806151 [Trichonephila clavipes]
MHVTLSNNRRSIGNGSRNCEPRSSEEDKTSIGTPFFICHTTLTGGLRASTDLMCVNPSKRRFSVALVFKIGFTTTPLTTARVAVISWLPKPLISRVDVCYQPVRMKKTAGRRSWFVAGLVRLRLQVRSRLKLEDFHDAENQVFMLYDYTACKRSLECLSGLGALGKIKFLGQVHIVRAQLGAFLNILRVGSHYRGWWLGQRDGRPPNHLRGVPPQKLSRVERNEIKLLAG